MGILECPATMPEVDTYGIPDYRVTVIRVDVNGADVRILAGDTRFGQVSWSHICTIPAAALLQVFPQFEQAMLMAMNAVGSDEVRCAH